MNYIQEYTDIVFQELPDHISLAFSITGCGLHCNGCHSPLLQDKANGKPLTKDIFEETLLKYSPMISAVVFFGGELFPKDLIPLLKMAHDMGLKTALYTGFDIVDSEVMEHLDFLKTGHYDEKLGPLNSPTTNQKMVDLNTGEDITYKFNRKIEAKYEID